MQHEPEKLKPDKENIHVHVLYKAQCYSVLNYIQETYMFRHFTSTTLKAFGFRIFCRRSGWTA